MGYAFSAVPPPLLVADSRVLKPWRKPSRGRVWGRKLKPENFAAQFALQHG
jgi:hypothetical protein